MRFFNILQDRPSGFRIDCGLLCHVLTQKEERRRVAEFIASECAFSLKCLWFFYRLKPEYNFSHLEWPGRPLLQITSVTLGRLRCFPAFSLYGAQMHHHNWKGFLFWQAAPQTSSHLIVTRAYHPKRASCQAIG